MLFHFAVVVSSSCSTDETIVAESDFEDETSKPLHEPEAVHMKETTENKENALPDNSALGSENVHSMYEEKTSPKNGDGCVVIRRDKSNDSGEGTSDIIYTQDIIVRTTNIQARTSGDAAEVNFKRFRKVRRSKVNLFLLLSENNIG